MTPRESAVPLQAVAERVIARYLRRAMNKDVDIVSRHAVQAARGIDIVYASPDGVRRSAKVKADSYFGTDTRKIGDRSLPFYRADTGSFAFEAVADSVTREPGWMIDSEADELYYYYLALAQEEEDVRALLKEPDEVFFPEIRVERDDLIILPMAATRRWFADQADNYPPRPVSLGGRSAWCRLVSRSDVQTQVEGVRIVGPVFPGLAI
jgi:hypothetical protein